MVTKKVKDVLEEGRRWSRIRMKIVLRKVEDGRVVKKVKDELDEGLRYP